MKTAMFILVIISLLSAIISMITALQSANYTGAAGWACTIIWIVIYSLEKFIPK